MIYDYQIKKNGNEEILYLYFDFSDNFAKNNINRKNIRQKIKDFIIDNDIVFKGIVVAVVVGGTFIGTIDLNKPYNSDISKNIKVSSIINIENEKEFISKNNIKDEKKAINNASNKSNEKKEKVSNVKDESIKNKNNIQNKTIKNINNSKQEIVSNNLKPTIENEESKKEEIVDNNTYVKVKNKDGNIITIELEEYLVGVVGAEMPASFHIEALKAQAVVSRTYAINALRTNKILTTTSSTQNYKTIDELKSLWGSSFNTYYNKVKNAVYSTKGEFITYNGDVIDAVFHSTSNGQTESAQYVWGNSKPYLVSVSSPYDSTNSSFIKEVFFTYNDLSMKLSLDINFLTEFNIIDKTQGNRINNIDVINKRFSGVEIRNLLGLRSADFDIVKQDDGILFITRGYGHGVGLSQYGANGYAKNGYNYQNIIKHYYTGVSLNHL